MGIDALCVLIMEEYVCCFTVFATLCDGENILAQKEGKLLIECGELLSLVFDSVALHAEVIAVNGGEAEILLQTTGKGTLVYDGRQARLSLKKESSFEAIFSMDPEKRISALLYSLNYPNQEKGE